MSIEFSPLESKREKQNCFSDLLRDKWTVIQWLPLINLNINQSFDNRRPEKYFDEKKQNFLDLKPTHSKSCQTKIP